MSREIPNVATTAAPQSGSGFALIIVPVLTSAYMAYRARKKKSLTPNGCLAAFGVGTAIGVLGGGGAVLVQNLLCSQQVDLPAFIAPTLTEASTFDGDSNFEPGKFSKAMSKAKQLAKKGTTVAKETANRILYKNTLFALLLRKDQNGNVIETPPQQLLPFGALINFFFTSTYLTKLGAKRKEREIQVESEETYDPKGNRNSIQVLCNGGLAAGLAVLVHFSRCIVNHGYLNPTTTLLPFRSLAKVIYYFSTVSDAVLALALIAQIAAAQGDTWSSEIGVLSKSPYAFLIVGLRRVPKGTNGGVTFLGTFAAFAAGLQLGCSLAAAQLTTMAIICVKRGDLSIFAVARYVSASIIRAMIPWRLLTSIKVGIKAIALRQKHKVDGVQSAPIMPLAVTTATIFATCIAASLGGSLLDSILGQFVQESKIVTPEPQKNLNDQEMTTTTQVDAVEKQKKHISGFALLSNNGVNFATNLAVITAAVLILHD